MNKNYSTAKTDENSQEIIVRVAESADAELAKVISDQITSSAKERGTGIAKRTPEYIRQKIEAGRAVIAYKKPRNAEESIQIAGFCYVESWGGIIVL